MLDRRSLELFSQESQLQDAVKNLCRFPKITFMWSIISAKNYIKLKIFDRSKNSLKLLPIQ